MKLVSWNVNGIRSVARKGFLPWLKAASPQVACLQETRAWPQQLDEDLLAPKGYKSWWVCAEKKGYSGVGALQPGRARRCRGGTRPNLNSTGKDGYKPLRFANFTLVNAYFPNGQRDHARVPFKMEFLRRLFGLLPPAQRPRGTPNTVRRLLTPPTGKST